MSLQQKPHCVIACISDTHFTGSGRTKHGTDEATTMKFFLESLENEESAPTNLIVHCGDIVEDGSSAAYAAYLETLSACNIPFRYIPGNHDNLGAMKNLMEIPEAMSYPNLPGSFLDYTEVVLGERLIFLDGNHEDIPDPQGFISKEQLSWLEETIQNSEERISLFTHFPPFLIDDPWAAKNMVLHNGEKLRELLGKYNNRLALVACGHHHRSMGVVEEGVFYQVTGSLSWQYQWSSGSDEGGPEPLIDHPGCYSRIEYYTDHVRVYDKIIG